MKKFIPLLFVLLWVFGVSSCGSNGGGNASEKPAIFFSTMANLTLEVAYEPGAEPFTGNLPNLQNIWTISESNLNALFQGRSKVPTVTVPKTLAEMTAIGAQNQTAWTSDKILALASKTRKVQSTSTQARFFLVFVKGNYQENGAINSNVIGVSISGTTVIAMFKDVIQSTGTTPDGAVPKFVEQAAIVHESGHALGLTNNGIPMKASHQDTAHGAHCSNKDCVMYWSNEGTTGLVSFIQKYLVSSSYVMFGSECLDDTRGYAP